MPQGLVPGNNGVVNTTRVALDWNDVNCATKYVVVVRMGNPSGTVADQNKNLTVSTFTTKALKKNTVYVWHVRVCNAIGCATTPWLTFTIK